MVFMTSYETQHFKATKHRSFSLQMTIFQNEITKQINCFFIYDWSSSPRVILQECDNKKQTKKRDSDGFQFLIICLKQVEVVVL